MTTGRRILIFFTAGLIIAGWSFSADAQSTHLTAKNLGLGGGGTAYVDGYHANFINPANLMLGEGREPRFTFGLLGGISTDLGGPLVNINVYNQYFTTGATVTGSLAEEALNKWFGADPTQMKRLGIQTDIIPVGLSYRGKNWGASLALRSRLLLNTAVNKGFAQLGIMGFDSDVFSGGQPVNFSAEALSFYEVSAGFSIKLLEIKNLGFARNVKVYAGAAPKMLLGANTSKINFNSVLTLKGAGQNDIDEIIHDFEYTFETNGELTDQLKQFYEDRQTQQDTPDISDYVDPAPEDFYGINATGYGLDLGGTIEMDLNLPVLGAFFKGPEHLTVGLSLTDLGSLSFDQKVDRFKADDVLDWKGFNFDQNEIDKKYNGNRDDYVNHVLQDSIATEIYGSFSPQGVASLNRILPTMLNFGSQLRLNFEFSFAASTVARSLNNGTNVGAAWSGIVLKF
jgi:hypothetical protein